MSRTFTKSCGKWFLVHSVGFKFKWEGSVSPLENASCGWLDIPGIPYKENRRTVDLKNLLHLFGNIQFDKSGRIIKISPTLLKLFILILHAKKKSIYHPSLIFPPNERSLINLSQNSMKYWPFKPKKVLKGHCSSSLHCDANNTIVKHFNRTHICTACKHKEKHFNYALWPTRERIRNCLLYGVGTEIDDWLGQHNFKRALLYLFCKDLTTSDIMDLELYTKELDLTMASWPSENIFKQVFAKRFIDEIPDLEYLFNFVQRSELGSQIRNLEELGFVVIPNKFKLKNNCQYFEKVLIGDVSYIYFRSLENIFKTLSQQKYTLVMTSPDYYNEAWIGPLQLLNVEDVSKALSTGQYDTLYGNVTMCRDGHCVHKCLPRRGRIMSIIKNHFNICLRDIGVEHTTPYLKHQQAIEAETQMPWNLEKIDSVFIEYLNKKFKKNSKK